MALNLVRNSRLFFTTNVNSTTGVVAGTAHTATSTYEIQVLEGFSFSQNTNAETITVSEAGVSPVRGQRSFNTSLAPVDFSFSTYIRPYKASNEILCEESVLWNALAGSEVINTAYTKGGTFSDASYATSTNTLTITGSSMTVSDLAVGMDVLIQGVNSSNATTATALAQEKVVNGPGRVLTLEAGSITIRMHNPGTSDITTTDLDVANIAFYKSAWGTNGTTSGQPVSSILGFHGSNKNQLLKVGLVVIIDGVSYAIDNAAMTQVTIDFGLDGIATAQWTGQATAMRQLTSNVTASGGTFGGGLDGNYKEKVTGANFITNKLSTATLKTVKALGTIGANTPYYVAITGGSITINNNITYITPAILSIVNQPVTYFTGTRSVTGSINAYLNTGSVSGYTGGGTGNLLKDMLAAASTVTEPMFALELAIGGSSNTVKVELQMPSVSIGVPTINTEQVVSTTINFTAAASDQDGSAEYDLGFTNDLTVRYYS